MSHTHRGDAGSHGGMGAQAISGNDVPAGQDVPVASILNTFAGDQQSELLEMLHVPLLHGGVKEVLLLASCATTSAASFAVACCVLAVCAGVLEMLRLLLWWVESQFTSGGEGLPRPITCDCKHCTSLSLSVASAGERRHYDAIHDTSSSSKASIPQAAPPPALSPVARQLCWGFVGSLHFLIYVVATLLMLIAMTMNIYLILSMGVGAALGKMIAVYIRKRLMATSK